MITDIKGNENIVIDKSDWDHFSLTLDLLLHERDKINGNFVESDNIEELFDYLDN